MNRQQQAAAGQGANIQVIDQNANASRQRRGRAAQLQRQADVQAVQNIAPIAGAGAQQLADFPAQYAAGQQVVRGQAQRTRVSNDPKNYIANGEGTFMFKGNDIERADILAAQVQGTVLSQRLRAGISQDEIAAALADDQSRRYYTQQSRGNLGDGVGFAPLNEDVNLGVLTDASKFGKFGSLLSETQRESMDKTYNAVQSTRAAQYNDDVQVIVLDAVAQDALDRSINVGNPLSRMIVGGTIKNLIGQTVPGQVFAMTLTSALALPAGSNNIQWTIKARSNGSTLNPGSSTRLNSFWNGDGVKGTGTVLGEMSANITKAGFSQTGSARNNAHNFKVLSKGFLDMLKYNIMSSFEEGKAYLRGVVERNAKSTKGSNVPLLFDLNDGVQVQQVKALIRAAHVAGGAEYIGNFATFSNQGNNVPVLDLSATASPIWNGTLTQLKDLFMSLNKVASLLADPSKSESSVISQAKTAIARASRDGTLIGQRGDLTKAQRAVETQRLINSAQQELQKDSTRFPASLYAVEFKAGLDGKVNTKGTSLHFPLDGNGRTNPNGSCDLGNNVLTAGQARKKSTRNLIGANGQVIATQNVCVARPDVRNPSSASQDNYMVNVGETKLSKTAFQSFIQGANAGNSMTLQTVQSLLYNANTVLNYQNTIRPNARYSAQQIAAGIAAATSISSKIKDRRNGDITGQEMEALRVSTNATLADRAGLKAGNALNRNQDRGPAESNLKVNDRNVIQSNIGAVGRVVGRPIGRPVVNPPVVNPPVVNPPAVNPPAVDPAEIEIALLDANAFSRYFRGDVNLNRIIVGLEQLYGNRALDFVADNQDAIINVENQLEALSVAERLEAFQIFQARFPQQGAQQGAQ